MLVPEVESTLHFETVLEGNPRPKERPRRGKYGFYTPKQTQMAEKEIKEHLAALLEENGLPEKDDEHWFGVTLRFYTGSKRRVDLDNLAKLVLDASNKLVWADDCQINELHVTLTMADPDPRTEMAVYITGARTTKK